MFLFLFFCVWLGRMGIHYLCHVNHYLLTYYYVNKLKVFTRFQSALLSGGVNGHEHVRYNTLSAQPTKIENYYTTVLD